MSDNPTSLKISFLTESTGGLSRSRLYQQIVDRIRKQIIDGSLQHGDRLPGEYELARRFGVSRTVIRESLKTLVENGLIEIRHGEGAFVCDGTVNALRQSLRLMMSFSGSRRLEDIVGLREILEPEIAYQAARHARPEDIRHLERAIGKMDQNLDAVEAYIAADNQFHLALAVATGNELLPRVLESVVDALVELRTHIGRVKEAPKRGQVHHRRILEAVANHRADEARTAMVDHLRQVRDDVQRASKTATKRKSP
jgi:GntR family transcriptional regulator, transcriptional repressor for pyruvate dehydrogenase complex